MCIPLPTDLAILIGSAGALLLVWWAIHLGDRPWTLEGIGRRVGFSLILLILLAVALSSLDGVLSRTHELGVADLGIDDLMGGPWGAWAGSARFADLFHRWLSSLRTGVVLDCYLRIDALLFIPTYAWFLMIAFARFYRKTQRFRSRPRTDRLDRFQIVVLLVGGCGVVADQLENYWLAHGVPGIGRLIGAGAYPLLPLRIAIAVKWLAILFILLVGVLPSALLSFDREHSRQVFRSVLQVVWRLRVLVVAIVVFGLVTTMSLQTPDAFRRWSVAQGLVAEFLTLLFALLIWFAGRYLLMEARNPEAKPPGDMTLVWLGLVVTAVGLVGWSASWGPRGLVIPGIALLLVGLLGRLYTERKYPDDDAPPEPEEPHRPRHLPASKGEIPGAAAAPRFLACLPIVLLAIGGVKATLPQTVFNHPGQGWIQQVVLVAGVLLPTITCIVLYTVLAWIPQPKERLRISHHLGPAAVVTLVLLFVWTRAISAPWTFPQMLGALGVLVLFMIVFTIVASLISLAQERIAPPSFLHSVGFSRVPILGFILVWALLVGTLERPGYHDVRLETAGRAAVSISPQQALDEWRRRVPPGADRAIQPLVFVTTSGGGIKAAIWTSLVLDCVFGDGSGIRNLSVREMCRKGQNLAADRWGAVFVASGVSGGSLGLTAFSTYEGRPDWIRDALGDDFVSPNLSWQMFVETPRGLLQFGNAMDRGEVLERAWERGPIALSAADRAKAALLTGDGAYEGPLSAPFMDRWQNLNLPLLMLSGTVVENGCHFIVSPLRLTGTGRGTDCTGITGLDLAASSDDSMVASSAVADFLCIDGKPADVSMSTAALLSARFPYVSPSGRLELCGTPDGGPPQEIHVVDGGYLDNSGGTPVAALWDQLGPGMLSDYATDRHRCDVPVLLQIDAGYGPNPDSTGGKRPEFATPLAGLASSKASRTIEGRDAAALPFRKPLPGLEDVKRNAIVYLRTNPEGQAPLGWTIDDSTIDQLELQLQANSAAIATVNSWFNGDACPPVGAS